MSTNAYRAGVNPIRKITILVSSQLFRLLIMLECSVFLQKTLCPTLYALCLVSLFSYALRYAPCATRLS
jgi:hypothetical protein